MAKLTMAQRRALPKSDFAVPSKAPGPGSYPMPDASHAANAKARASANASPAVQKRVDTMANKKLGPETKTEPKADRGESKAVERREQKTGREMPRRGKGK